MNLPLSSRLLLRTSSVALVAVFMFSGCGSSTDTTPGNDAIVLGVVSMFGLDGKEMPLQDSVTVHLDVVQDSTSFTTVPASNGSFAFRSLPRKFYALYATRHAFGYSNFQSIQANILSDTFQL